MSRFKPLSNIQSEFKKIAWLSKPELIEQSRIVLASILIVGCLVYTVDLVIQYGLSLLASLFKLMLR